MVCPHARRRSLPTYTSQVKVNTSNYGAALAAEFNDPIHGLYTTNTSLPLANGTGLRTHYAWGLYSYCAFSPNATTNSTALHGSCSNSTVGHKFQPYKAIRADMISNYTQFTDNIFSGTNSRFNDNNFLGGFTTGAYYLILLGTVCAALAFFM
jgi:hypothetical protein